MWDAGNWTVLLQSITTLGVAYIGYMSLRLGKTISTLEKNTNSIKDALVKATGDAQFQAGIMEQKRRHKEEEAPPT